jgi:pantoate--beta-alanine ligase
MKVFHKVKELSKALEELKITGNSVGFVPTMGALHHGHLSLIELAKMQNQAVLASIFVNPTQFNNPEDLKNYPRNIERDFQMLQSVSCNMVFIPDEKEIYPDENSKKTPFDFGYIASIMEGKYRPGHFNGVGTVVKRLFEIVKPNRAYFGQKDIQQYLIIKKMNDNYLPDLNIELVKCPIIRESDGLAMSSRNALLSPDQRKSAALIAQTLFEAKKNYKQYTPESLKNFVIEKINTDANLSVEYFELVNDPDLKMINSWGENDNILACIAVQVGNVRLIDNIYIN